MFPIFLFLLFYYFELWLNLLQQNFAVYLCTLFLVKVLVGTRITIFSRKDYCKLTLLFIFYDSSLRHFHSYWVRRWVLTNQTIYGLVWVLWNQWCRHLHWSKVDCLECSRLHTTKLLIILRWWVSCLLLIQVNVWLILWVIPDYHPPMGR